VRKRAPSRPTKLVLVWTAYAVSGLFAYLALRNVRFGEVWAGLTGSNYWWTLPALGLLSASVVLRAVRWRYLFADETRPPTGAVLQAAIIGQFFNNVLPARAGEAARVIALNQSSRTSRAETTATIVAERAYDVLALLMLLFVLLPWLPHVSWVPAAAILAAGVAAGLALAIVLLVLFGDRPFFLLLRPLSRLPFLGIERTEGAAASFHRGTASLHRPRLAVLAFVLTTISWVLIGLSNWVLMLGFDLRLSPLAGLLVIVAVGLASILPASPAGVGVFEAATLVALNAYGVPKSDALSYALVLHALNFVPYVAAGALVLNLRAISLRKSL
jgi:uncharacterized protein (TIRG00374 family)